MKTIEEQIVEFNFRNMRNDYFKRCSNGHIVDPCWKFCAECGEKLKEKGKNGR